jgi:hypothetical protein
MLKIKQKKPGRSEKINQAFWGVGREKQLIPGLGMGIGAFVGFIL